MVKRTMVNLAGGLIILAGGAFMAQAGEESDICANTDSGTYCAGETCCFTGGDSCSTDPETCEEVCADNPDDVECQN